MSEVPLYWCKATVENNEKKITVCPLAQTTRFIWGGGGGEGVGTWVCVRLFTRQDPENIEKAVKPPPPTPRRTGASRQCTGFEV